LLLPGERGLKEPTGTEKQEKRRRKSNKELEDFHGSQALDGGRRPQTDRTKEVLVAAEPRLILEKMEKSQ